MHNHIGCICLFFLQCVFSNVSSNFLDKRMHSRTGCICLTFLHCVFLNVSSNHLPERIQNYIDHIYLTFLYCTFPHALLWYEPQDMLVSCRNYCIECKYASHFWQFHWPSNCRQPFLAISSVLLHGHWSNKKKLHLFCTKSKISQELLILSSVTLYCLPPLP